MFTNRAGYDIIENESEAVEEAEREEGKAGEINEKEMRNL